MWGDPVADAVIVLEHRLSTKSSSESSALPSLQLPLTAEQRTVLRGRRRARCGRDWLLQLPREGPLQPGDQLMNGSRTLQVTVVAAPEPLLRVQATTALELLQAAYHLGNRHVSLELHPEELLLLKDFVLEAMLRSRGLQVSSCERPFVPEGGAYGGIYHATHEYESA